MSKSKRLSVCNLKKISLSDVDSLALEFSAVFFNRSQKGAWKHRSYKLALVMFFFMFASCGLFLFAGRESRWHVLNVDPLFFLLSMMVFELLAIYFLEKYYESVWRDKSLRKASLIEYGAVYDKRNLKAYKERWLRRAFDVSPDRYIELVKAIVEAGELKRGSQSRTQSLGDRLMTGFFSLKPLGGLSLFSLLIVLGSVVLKAVGSNYEKLKNGVEGYLVEFWWVVPVSIFLLVIAVVGVGLMLLIFGGVFRMVLERKFGVCSSHSRERLIHQLIMSSVIVLK